MCFFSYRLFLAIVVCMAVASVVVAQDEPVPEAVAEGEPEEAVAPEAAPPPVALIANMTVNEILNSVKAPVRETYRGKVSEVVTGMMVIIERNGSAMKVRLYGIDCPEPGQIYHQEARQFAEDRFLNETVNVSVLTTDSQQNPVVLVFNAQGESLSHLMAAYGMAWWDRRNAQSDALLRRLNAEAISHSVGLYADPTSLAPWDYRNSRGLDQFTYSLEQETASKPEPRTTRPSNKEETEPKVLSAKGTMTQNAARGPVNITKNATKDIDHMALIGKHQPEIVEDDSGKVLGLTASDISQIPYAAQLGFQDNDIVSSVNGIAVQSIPQIMQMAPQFKDTKQFNVEVIRNGQRVTIPITVP